MNLPNTLISQFVKVTKDSTPNQRETTLYGTTVEYNEELFVRLDGSELLTPVSRTTDVNPNERVMVVIKDHTAIITGNISSPAARTGDVKALEVSKLSISDSVSMIPTPLTSGFRIADIFINPSDKTYIRGLIANAKIFNTSINSIDNPMYQFYSNGGDFKTGFDTTFANLVDLTNVYPGLLDENIATEYTLTDIDIINGRIFDYINQYNTLTGYLAQFFKNASKNVIIDTNGIHIGTFDNAPGTNTDGSYIDLGNDGLGGPNSRLTSSVLEFKYGNQRRVAIESDSTLVNNARLEGNTVINNEVVLPPSISFGAAMDVVEIAGGLNWNFK